MRLSFYIYVLLLSCLLLLFWLSRHEKAQVQDNSSPVTLCVRRSACYIYRRLFLREYQGQRLGRLHGLFRENRSVLYDLSALHPDSQPRSEAELYQVRKIQNFLTLAVAMCLVCILLSLYNSQQPKIDRHGQIRRNLPEGTDMTITAIASDAGSDRAIGPFSFTVSRRSYTQAECDAFAAQLIKQLPLLILGDNADTEHVCTNLRLASSYEGYPFRISWESSLYRVVTTEGKVSPAAIEDGGSSIVNLHAVMRCDAYIYETSIPVTVIPVPMNAGEELMRDIGLALADSDQATLDKPYFTMPGTAAGTALKWSENIPDNSLPVFFLFLAAAAAQYLLSDRQLHSQRSRRDRALVLDYPQIISKIVLFLGAGMSLRNIFHKLGDDYLQKQKEGGRKQYVYEEILLVCHELDSGIPEQSAYTHFGQRCRVRQYTKLCALLTQNLKKGNHSLLPALQEEAEYAFEQRKSNARQQGEEAGTRLLGPMVMMLVVTLMIIMLPAYFNFGV